MKRNLLKKAYRYLLRIGAKGVVILALVACDKEDAPINPNQAAIDQLTKDVKTQTTEVRAAIEPAKRDPYDIAGTFDDVFHEEENRVLGHQARNIIDSSEVIISTEARLLTSFEEYSNPVNGGILSGKAKTLVLTNAQLQKLLGLSK
jgi:hypothetical protein